MNLRPYKVFNIPIFYKLLKKKGTMPVIPMIENCHFYARCSYANDIKLSFLCKM